MVFSMIPTRLLHLQKQCFALEKSLLATLRKKTGYTFTNCKKALDLHNNDLNQAEKWLKEQAQALGWSKATKLEGRQTLQGLIGVIVNNKNAALIEVNCETDFVARNKEFQKYVEQATQACLNFIGTAPNIENNHIKKINLSCDDLKQIQGHDGKTLSDGLALMIGNLGENASLRRAYCFKVDDGVNLVGYGHPARSDLEPGDVSLGKFGGLVAFKQFDSRDVNLMQVGKDICQHIVGMNPKEIGGKNEQDQKNKKDEETRLIYQDFLLDESISVGEYLEENGVEVLDFKRFECGEVLQGHSLKSQDFIETCQ